MSIQIVVPELGESVLEATVSRWLKQPGDPVSAGEVLVELETDKVNLEVGAKTSGVLAEILAAEGQDVQVGAVLGTIEEQVVPRQGPPEPTGSAEPAKPKEEGKLPVQAEGTAREETPPAEQSAPSEEEGKPRATPVAARMAQQMAVDLTRIPGSGPAGKVTKADVEQFVQQPDGGSQPAAAPPAEASQPAQPAPARAEPGGARGETRQRMSRRRRTIASRLLEAQQTTAMLTTFNEIDMSAVMDLRRRRQEEFVQRYGIKLGISSFFVKAVISALKAFPRLNGEIQGDEIVLKDYYDIGVAIGAEEGLVVPVLRAADRLSFAEIERQIKDFAQKTEQGQLTVEELRGGTFTITNGGVFGSLLSTPILNPPQTGILGMHAIKDRPVALDGEVVIRPMMYVALTYDHRIVDGREAVQFLVHVQQAVEDPLRLLLES